MRSHELFEALRAIARALGQRFTYERAERYSFPLGDGWTLRISQDSAGRLRIETCQRGRVVDTVWCRVDDRSRLAALVEAIEADGPAWLARSEGMSTWRSRMAAFRPLY